MEEVTSYSHGPKDICSVFFYLLIAVVLHAVVQEYVLDVSVFCVQKEYHNSQDYSSLVEWGRARLFISGGVGGGLDVDDCTLGKTGRSLTFVVVPPKRHSLKSKCCFQCHYLRLGVAVLSLKLNAKPGCKDWGGGFKGDFPMGWHFTIWKAHHKRYS